MYLLFLQIKTIEISSFGEVIHFPGIKRRSKSGVIDQL